jgi:kynurenine formamidase
MMPTGTESSVTNWGRWGAEDERGTLNLLTPEVVSHAAGLVKRGKVYSLAMPLAVDGPQWPTRHKTWKVTTFGVQPNGRGSADDVVTMHSHSGTHIDALCHVWYDDQLYNGHPAPKHVTSAGATRNAIDRVPSIVGRGVLLDMARHKNCEHLQAGEAITVADLDACAKAQGVEVRAGDIILLRTGWIRVFAQDRETFYNSEPGIDVSTLPWLKEHDIVAVAADNHAVEVMSQVPPPDLPIHKAAIRDLGLYLVEYLNLEELAADKVYESLVVIAPLPLSGGIGSPVNPIAIA